MIDLAAVISAAVGLQGQCNGYPGTQSGLSWNFNRVRGLRLA